MLTNDFFFEQGDPSRVFPFNTEPSLLNVLAIASPLCQCAQDDPPPHEACCVARSGSSENGILREGVMLVEKFVRYSFPYLNLCLKISLIQKVQ